MWREYEPSLSGDSNPEQELDFVASFDRAPGAER